MLGWLVDREVVTAVLKDPKQLIQEISVEVQLDNLPDAVLDENVDIQLIHRYFSNDAWLLGQDVISRNPVYTCKICYQSVHHFLSIVCEHCLTWFHMKCV